MELDDTFKLTMKQKENLEELIRKELLIRTKSLKLDQQKNLFSDRKILK
jgi:hypothetical protein